ncbi:Protein of unknown function [Pyronema omphalodes CBS 100304]|uniref:Uncharacterized protein n=1 Tax=Pyronema omphalodes (strain CBS 100304) TaxID=1076935 RepID=U4LDQ2_PYROM|nr:Protein of unknown function [Pyronema omphalodes CBS 100304]
MSKILNRLKKMVSTPKLKHETNKPAEQANPPITEEPESIRGREAIELDCSTSSELIRHESHHTCPRINSEPFFVPDEDPEDDDRCSNCHEYVMDCHVERIKLHKCVQCEKWICGECQAGIHKAYKNRIIEVQDMEGRTDVKMKRGGVVGAKGPERPANSQGPVWI